MKLADLRPKLVAHPEARGAHSFSFDCPKCGSPYRVVIQVLIDGAPDARRAAWGISLGNDLGWAEATIVPSIDITPCGHGRKKPCNWHGTITNGDVINA